MPSAPKMFRPRGMPERREVEASADARRGSARARGYTTTWDKARKAFIAAHPLCEYCAAEGMVVPATLVDHLYPHRRYEGVFWCSEWWVSSCAPCHDGPKQRAEASGKPALDALARRLARPVMA